MPRLKLAIDNPSMLCWFPHKPPETLHILRLLHKNFGGVFNYPSRRRGRRG